VTTSVTGPPGFNVIRAAFNSVALTPAWTLTENVLVNGGIFASATFTGANSTGSAESIFANAYFYPGQATTITAEYVINTGPYCCLQVPGLANAGIRIDSVPGPIAGAGLPGLILASGGFLAWWRRRQSFPRQPSHVISSSQTGSRKRAAVGWLAVDRLAAAHPLGHVFACLLWIVVIHLLWAWGMPSSTPSCLPPKAAIGSL